MKVYEVMTTNVISIKKDSTILDAIKKMKDKDVGFLIIEENKEALGIITDRDIVIALAKEISTNTNITKIMKKYVITVNQNEEIEKASDIMGYMQIKRLVATNDENKITGVLSISDILRYPFLEECALETIVEISYNYSTKNNEYDKTLQTNAFIL